MSLRERLRAAERSSEGLLLRTYGVVRNPFPTANQTSGNPHHRIEADATAEERIATFIREQRSEVLVVIGTQGVGKTNLLNYLEAEVRGAELQGYYVVRYMADPEASFDGTIRSIFQELGVGHLRRTVEALRKDSDALEEVRSFDLRQALLSLSSAETDDERAFERCLEWLYGFRLLNEHRHNLGVSFRLNTVESRTAVLRDYVFLSVRLGVLSGVFLLLDELEKQAGVLGPRAVVRYLSALRAIIDALPKHLFMVMALTPDAMRRYASALPAFRSRLESQVRLAPLDSLDEAAALANFYLECARKEADGERTGGPAGALVTRDEIERAYEMAEAAARRRGDEGVRQREFLNGLHDIAEEKIQSVESFV